MRQIGAAASATRRDILQVAVMVIRLVSKYGVRGSAGVSRLSKLDDGAHRSERVGI